jgi:hypothetical protein
MTIPFISAGTLNHGQANFSDESILLLGVFLYYRGPGSLMEFLALNPVPRNLTGSVYRDTK